MFRNSVIYSVCLFISIAIFSIPNVDCQICNRRTTVTISKNIPYTYTYRENYIASCWYGRCRRTRIQSRRAYRTITTREIRYLEECCEGYIREENTDLDTISCKPICMPSCVNGYCKEPGVCVCNKGFVVDRSNSHSCLPICSKGCSHGTCVAPETCKCDYGYSLNGTCQPICSEPCVNGLCTGPDICECLDGYRKSVSNRCDPYCFKGCANGTCIQPEVCQCDAGYTKIEEECVPVCKECGNGACIAPNTCRCDSGYIFLNETCQPTCNNSCENGKCVAPDTCDCNTGYRLENGTCEPFCSMDCGFGKCDAPDVCKCDFAVEYIKDCDPYCCGHDCDTDCQHGLCTIDGICECNSGYKIYNDDEICLPVCVQDCGNGTCVEPNTCKCHSGYEANERGTSPYVCVPICQNCEGTCVAPDECICTPSYEARNEGADGDGCDCFSNCSDASRKCHRTTCILVTTTTEYILPSNTTDSTSVVTTSDKTHQNLLDEIDWTLTEEDNITTTLTQFDSSSTSEHLTDISNDTVKPMRDNYTRLNTTNSNMTADQVDTEHWSFPIWLTVVLSIFTIMIIIAVVFIIRIRS